MLINFKTIRLITMKSLDGLIGMVIDHTKYGTLSKWVIFRIKDGHRKTILRTENKAANADVF